MRVVLDTNVFVSGVFFSGPPNRILEAWRDGEIRIVLSPEILEEYRRVGEALAEERLGIDLNPFLQLVAIHADIIDAPGLSEPVASDPDDDKFLACAAAAGAEIIVSGDKALLRASGWHGISVVSPRMFVDRHLRQG